MQGISSFHPIHPPNINCLTSNIYQMLILPISKSSEVNVDKKQTLQGRCDISLLPGIDQCQLCPSSQYFSLVTPSSAKVPAITHIHLILKIKVKFSPINLNISLHISQYLNISLHISPYISTFISIFLVGHPFLSEGARHHSYLNQGQIYPR